MNTVDEVLAFLEAGEPYSEGEGVLLTTNMLIVLLAELRRLQAIEAAARLVADRSRWELLPRDDSGEYRPHWQDIEALRALFPTR